ncbi:hypothetical protein NDU88_005550 [Pleurodeles waltl]|uniref:Uncharacterized protein n=1 Tax=Pleurodeles waltl TaxID=8319 RepID=A0AAV7PIE8_PLEWA|nr:hypothetical protein NDU88_005550 [Pleurodeles waltl]
MLAFGSDAEERKTTDRKEKEGVDDGESRDVSRGSPSWAEPAAPSADYRPKENTKKLVVYEWKSVNIDLRRYFKRFQNSVSHELLLTEVVVRLQMQFRCSSNAASF